MPKNKLNKSGYSWIRFFLIRKWSISRILFLSRCKAWKVVLERICITRESGREMKMPTKKQMSLIKNMEILLDIKFSGNTIREASEFISKNIERYKEEQEFVFDMVYNENNY